MTEFRAGQLNFSRGVIAPTLYGRFDVDAYAAAIKTGVNVLVMKYGGLTKRPGFRFVAEVMDDSEATRLFPFQFSLSQAYILEKGQGYMSPMAGGGRILEEHLEITAITNAANAQITAAFHNYDAGDLVYLQEIEGALGAYLNNRYWEVVTDVDGDNFTINADTSALAAFTAAAGGDTRTGDPDPPPAPPVVTPAPTPAPPPVVGGPGDRIPGPGESYD